MKILLLPLVIALVIGSAPASEDEGLFIPNREVEPKYDIDDGEIVMRLASERLQLTRAVFRYDTEDKEQYWLELDFTKWADPGSFFVFKIGELTYTTGFTVRGEGTNQGGGRWALGLKDADIGRRLLAKIAAIYALPDSHALDQSEGEQGGAGQPATRSESDSEGNAKPQPESEGRSR
jgi:hypothetical protein